MAIKPFAIQGADLTLGGVSLQAGTGGGIVIPGVTRAATFQADEVEDLGDQTDTWQDIPVVIDQETYNRLAGIINLNDGWVAPTYEVQELDDDGYIDGIDVTDGGTIPDQAVVTHMEDNMFAAPAGSSIDPQTFDANVWVAIPFYVKCRAGEVELEGGGSGGSGGVVERTVNFPTGEEGDTTGTLALTPDDNLYICIADYQAVETVDYSVPASESYDKDQSINGTDMVVTVLKGEDEDLDALMAALTLPSTNWQLEQSSATDGYTRDCVAAEKDSTHWKFTWQFVGGQDNSTFSQDDEFTLFYTATQPAIWEQLNGGVNGLVSEFGSTGEEGDELYNLTLNEDISIRTYQGNAPQGNGFSIGRNNETDTNSLRRSGVVAIGNDDVGYNSKVGGVYIGYAAGWNSTDDGDGTSPQGENAIAIGAKAAYDFAEDNSITLNATGVAFNPTGAGLFVKPIQQDVENTAKALYYNTTTGEVTYANPTATGDSQVWIEKFLTVDGEADIPYQCESVEYDSEGSIIALFSHYQPANPSYFSVAKFDTSGTAVWEMRLGDGEFDADGWGLAVDNNNGAVYIAGQYNNGSRSIVTLTKLNGGNGSVTWHQSYDTDVDNYSPVVDVDSDGNILMVGVTTLANESTILTTKVSGVDGSVIWSRQLRGQNGNDATGMGVGPNNEVVTVGYGYNTTTYNAMGTMYSDPPSNPNWTINSTVSYGEDYLINFAFTDGVPSFTVVYDRVGNRTADETLYTVNGATLGGVTGVDDMTIKVGTIATNNEADIMLVVKYDTEGVLDWQKTVQFDPQYSCTGADADIDSEGNIYVCGQYYYDNGNGSSNNAMLLFKFNSNGVKQWSRTVVGDCDDYFSSIVVGPDDYLYLSGQTIRLTNTDFLNVVAKYDKDGTVMWQRLIDYTAGWNGGTSGSNIAVKNGYLAYGGSYSNGPSQEYAYLAQLPTDGTTFTVSDWAYSVAAFSGVLDSTASNITVTNANKIHDAYNGTTVDEPTYSTDISEFLVITKLEAFPPTSAGSVIEYRDDINFPTGEVGDTAGTIVVTAGGATFVCIADYVDTPATDFTVVSSEDFNVSQTAGQRGILTIQTGDFPDVDALWTNRESAIPSGWTIASSVLAETHTAYDFGNWSTGLGEATNNRYITWNWDSADENHISPGTEYTLTYTPANRIIWVRLDNGRFVVDGNTITVDGRNNNDLRISSAGEDVSSNIELVDDDKVVVTAAGENSWEFNKDGRITFPDGTRQETAFINRNINVDGGGAAVHYEQEIGFVDGGFSATRHGVADPIFNGGDRLTEDNQFNLNGGGA